MTLELAPLSRPMSSTEMLSYRRSIKVLQSTDAFGVRVQSRVVRLHALKDLRAPLAVQPEAQAIDSTTGISGSPETLQMKLSDFSVRVTRTLKGVDSSK